MDGRLFAALTLIALTGLGYFMQLRRRTECAGEAGQVGSFRQAFVEWVNSAGQRRDLYQRLLMESRAIQGLVNASGERFDYRAPFGAYVVPNYQTISNSIPLIERELSDQGMGTPLSANEHAKLVDDALIRLMGHLSTIDQSISRQLRNPLFQFGAGVRAVLSVPSFVLQSFGISIGAWQPVRVIGGLFSRLVTVTAFVASVVTIVVGWPQAEALLRGLGEP